MFDPDNKYCKYRDEFNCMEHEIKPRMKYHEGFRRLCRGIINEYFLHDGLDSGDMIKRIKALSFVKRVSTSDLEY